MYKLISLTMKNLCQHDEATYTFDTGLNAITGPNGCGKSNLLRALAYGLTGLVDGVWGSQQTLQMDGTATPGYAEVVFSGNDGIYTIRRYSISSVKFPDMLTKKSDGISTVVAQRRQAVNTAMQQILGIPVSLFFQIMWGRQGSLDNFLTASPSVLDSFLAEVFNTKHASKLREILKDTIDNVATLSPACIDSLVKAQESLKSLPTIEELKNNLSAIQEAKTALETRVNELASRVSTGMTESAKKESVYKFEETITALEKRISDFESGAPPEVPVETAEEISAMYTQYTEDLSKLNAARKSFNDKLTEVDKLQVKVNITSANNENIISSVEDFLSKPAATCAYCGAAVNNTEEYINAGIAQLTKGLAHNKDEYAAMVKKVRGDIHTANKKLQSNKEKIKEALAAADAKNSDILAQLESVRLKKEQLMLYTSWEYQKDTISRDKEHLNAYKETLASIKASPVVSDEDKLTFAELATDLDILRDKESALNTDIIRTEATRSNLENNIKDLEQQVAQYKINKDVRFTLETLREVFSPKHAPARYLKSKIAEINNFIDDYMSTAQMPFTLQLNADTHCFEYTTTDGYIHPASHLSGAQKNMSAVILQMSLLSVIQPNMNLFMVDEPSEALDIENKFIQAEMFSRLATLMPSIEGVMLIVSRDEQIIEGCNNKIEIGK